jgi:predicted lactoylglutathione lyase
VYAEAADHGWMYQHSFEDLDGHQWEIVYMDESAMPKN